jgi:hypothetical protein
MTIAKIANPTMKAAVDALQSRNRQKWAALFEPNAELFDDGRPRSLESSATSTRISGESLGRTSSYSYHLAGESDDWTLD